MEYSQIYFYDRDPLILDLYADLLKDVVDANFILITSISELLERIQEQNPTVIIFDIELCKSTRGIRFDTIEKIKEHYDGPLFFTTCASLTHDEIMRLDPKKIFAKPFNIDSFANSISECLAVLEKTNSTS